MFNSKEIQQEYVYHNKEGLTLFEFIWRKGREEAIDELLDLIDRLLWNYDKETYKDLSESFKESARLLKEQNNG